MPHSLEFIRTSQADYEDCALGLNAKRGAAGPKRTTRGSPYPTPHRPNNTIGQSECMPLVEDRRAARCGRCYHSAFIDVCAPPAVVPGVHPSPALTRARARHVLRQPTKRQRFLLYPFGYAWKVTDAREGLVRPVRQSLVVRAGAQQKLFRRQAERAVNVDVTTTPISG